MPKAQTRHSILLIFADEVIRMTFLLFQAAITQAMVLVIFSLLITDLELT